jgi:hypothetical protein
MLYQQLRASQFRFKRYTHETPAIWHCKVATQLYNHLPPLLLHQRQISGERATSAVTLSGHKAEPAQMTSKLSAAFAAQQSRLL